MLPTEILNHFDMLKQQPNNGKISPKSLGDLLLKDSQKYVGVDLMQLSAICRKFVNEGLLIYAGSNSTSPPLCECYYSYNVNEKYANYGSYDFLINGFISIRNHFTKSVKPIIVTKSNGDEDIGTGFIISDNTLVTALHCIENMKNIKIEDNNKTPLQAEFYIKPKNPQTDIAYIVFKAKPFENIPHFQFATGNILDEILTIGYPPIAGFDAFQIAETATINTKSSIGKIIGQENSYLDNQELLLINARVKGGNSGGPIINKYGFIVGMLIQLPFDIFDPNKLDILGYGIAIPSAEITKTLVNLDVVTISVKNNDKGFCTIND